MLKIVQVGKPRIRPYAFKLSKVGLPFGGKSGNKEVLRVIEWLIVNIGSISSDKWELRGYSPAFMNVYITDATDAMAFKIRWI